MSLRNLTIKEREGYAAVADVTWIFEQMVRATPALAGLSLEAVQSEEKFEGYKDAYVDAFWAGFCLGIRTCEKLWQQGELPTAETFRRLNTEKQKSVPPTGGTAEDGAAQQRGPTDDENFSPSGNVEEMKE